MKIRVFIPCHSYHHTLSPTPIDTPANPWPSALCAASIDLRNTDMRPSQARSPEYSYVRATTAIRGRTVRYRAQEPRGAEGKVGGGQADGGADTGWSRWSKATTLSVECVILLFGVAPPHLSCWAPAGSWGLRPGTRHPLHRGAEAWAGGTQRTSGGGPFYKPTRLGSTSWRQPADGCFC